MAKPLETDFEYFLEIQPELAEEHHGSFVAIKNKQVLGIYDNYLEAARAVYAKHERGTVLMQAICKDSDANAIYLPTAVIVVTK